MDFCNQQDFKIQRDIIERTLLDILRDIRARTLLDILRDSRARTLLEKLRESRAKTSLFIHYAGSNGADANGREMDVEQDVHKNYNDSSHGTKLMKSTLGLASTILLPCAGGTDLKSGQPERQMDFRNQQDFMDFRNQQDFKIQRDRRARTLLFIHYAGSNGADANGREMDVEQDVHKNYNDSSHGTKLMKSTLGLASTILLPCAGGTDLKSGQPERQDHSEIYPSTLRYLSNCPSPMEYMNKTLEKCADACGSYLQDGNCAYHCMRDSSKTGLVEFCAKPKKLFVYCPEYDPVDQTIQKDLSTLCNSTENGSHYISSDIYFCDPANCLQLHESSVRSNATTLTTLMNETPETNSGEIQEWLMFLLVVAVALIIAILLCVLYVSFKRGSARTRKVTKKRNPNGLIYQNVGSEIPSEI